MTSTASDTPKVSAGFDINAEFRSVMHELGLSPEDTGGKITFVGEDPIFPSVHRLGACIAIPIMAGAAGIADIWRQRTGRGQDLTLDLRKAIHGINPGYKFMPTVNGYPYQLPYWVGAPPMGFDLYRTKDGRLFLPTGAYPRMLEGMCTFLGCSPDKDSIAKAVSQWDSEELDKAAAEAGVVYAIVRTPEEWAVHPQGKYLADKPLVEIIKIGDSDPEPFTPAARPLSGLRVLAATHVIAGNVMARTLAEHGAEVLQIAHPEEFENEGLMQDPCAGFTSSAWLDLAQPEGLRRAYELAAGADVFVENYRGHKIADLGMSPEELAARRPGIIYASGKAFSHDGPWTYLSSTEHGHVIYESRLELTPTPFSLTSILKCEGSLRSRVPSPKHRAWECKHVPDHMLTSDDGPISRGSSPARAGQPRDRFHPLGRGHCVR